MRTALDVLLSYLYIWKFDDPEEESYATYSKRNDLISFRLFTISIMLIVGCFLIVDLVRPVDYSWVLLIRGGLIVIYSFLLILLYVRDFSANGIQAVLASQIIFTYMLYFVLASVAKMPLFFLPNVLLLLFYTVGTITGLRFRYAILINLAAFTIFTIITEVRDEEYYHTQYPNIVSNLIISGITAAFIEKQKRKDFMQFTELLQRKEELDELNEQKNRVISILSHDVSAPLRSIGGLLTTYEKSQISKEELDRFLPDVRVRIDKVSMLVYSLVRWSKTQMKSFTIQRTSIDMGLLVSDNVALLKPLAGEKIVSIMVQMQAGLIVSGDHEMINLIIRNLLSNAVKFTPNGKSIHVNGFLHGNKVVIQISNEGEPIPSTVIEKLFTFQIRSRQGTANEAGTGLGLAMSQQFAVLLGGMITLEPRVGGNNTFSLELPAQ